ncbi:hypothetical protein, partial [Staphylococcus epidermidis]|uniref:hypothetical protein n=1 Tax=Staphylococcus epidermidis TaxID=1282 RepID=UPI0037DA57C8
MMGLELDGGEMEGLLDIGIDDLMGVGMVGEEFENDGDINGEECVVVWGEDGGVRGGGKLGEILKSGIGIM